MIREAIDKIISMTPTGIIKGSDGLDRSDRTLALIEPIKQAWFTTQTLLGFTELIAEAVDGFKKEEVVIQVLNPTGVALFSKNVDPYGCRRMFIGAQCNELNTFQFNNFQNSEQFIIGLQSHFVPGAGDTDYVLKMASALAAEAVSTADDDGISQRVAVRTGVALKSQEIVKPRIKLAPYRTFREVDQPVSDFVFRLRGRHEDTPMCALFEADGGRWKLDAVQAIAVWLSKNNADIPVIA
jgi:hypothetical protein